MHLIKNGKEKTEDFFNRIKSEGYLPRDSYQNISLEKISDFLKKIGRYSDDRRDTIFCLLNDELPNLYSTIKTTEKISAGASTAQIGSYIGILLRGRNNKLDREGRDNWIKPLIHIGIIEPIYLEGKIFVHGHKKPKSPNSAYRLKNEFVELLQKYDDDDFDQLIKEWLATSDERSKLLITYEIKSASNGYTHRELIDDSIRLYAKHYLPGYKCIYIDSDDGNRISEMEKSLLNKYGIIFGSLDDVWPDAILYNEVENSLWFIEAVTSDGEVDYHKLKGLEKICLKSGKRFGGCTTTYFSFEKFSNRQKSKNNLAHGSFVWIKEMPERQLLIQ